MPVVRPASMSGALASRQGVPTLSCAIESSDIGAFRRCRQPAGFTPQPGEPFAFQDRARVRR